MFNRWEAFIAFLVGVKLRYLIGVVLVWNLCCGLAIYVNGGPGQIRRPASALIIVVTVAALAASFFMLRWNAAVQAALLKSTADQDAVEQFALDMGIVLSIVAAVFALALAFSVPPN
jgi:hypothetical protein